MWKQCLLGWLPIRTERIPAHWCLTWVRTRILWRSGQLELTNWNFWLILLPVLWYRQPGRWEHPVIAFLTYKRLHASRVLCNSKIDIFLRELLTLGASVLSLPILETFFSLLFEIRWISIRAKLVLCFSWKKYTAQPEMNGLGLSNCKSGWFWWWGLCRFVQAEDLVQTVHLGVGWTELLFGVL